MGRVLDRSREYSETFGQTADLKYFQDGIWFDASGNEVGGDTEEPKTLEAPKRRREPKEKS